MEFGYLDIRDANNEKREIIERIEPFNQESIRTLKEKKTSNILEY